MIRLLPALEPEPPSGVRCPHVTSRFEKLKSESHGGGPAVLVGVMTCLACAWSWIVSKKRIA